MYMSSVRNYQQVITKCLGAIGLSVLSTAKTKKREGGWVDTGINGDKDSSSSQTCPTPDCRWPSVGAKELLALPLYISEELDL